MAKRTTTKAADSFDDRTRICVLHGPEAMLQRLYFERLCQVMKQAYGEIEVYQYDGQEVQLSEVLDELRSYGLIQQYKLVVVNHAQGFVSTHREALERYAKSPVDHATLVLRSEKWHKGNLDKSIAKVGCLVKCDAMSADLAQRWVVKRAETTHKRKISVQAAKLLVQRLGSGDLMKLDNELGKLALLVQEGQAIDVAVVEHTTGRSSDEQAWAVQEAVLAALAEPMDRRGGRAIEKIHELIELSGQPDVLVAYFVADLVRKFRLAVEMKRQGASERQIASSMKLWGGRQSAFMGVLRKLNQASAADLLDRIIALDVRSKSGFGKSLRNLECFCAASMQEM